VTFLLYNISIYPLELRLSINFQDILSNENNQMTFGELEFLTNADTFKNTIIDDEEQERTIYNCTDISKNDFEKTVRIAKKASIKV
jgi:hypothetical protein